MKTVLIIILVLITMSAGAADLTVEYGKQAAVYESAIDDHYVMVSGRTNFMPEKLRAFYTHYMIQDTLVFYDGSVDYLSRYDIDVTQLEFGITYRMHEKDYSYADLVLGFRYYNMSLSGDWQHASESELSSGTSIENGMLVRLGGRFGYNFKIGKFHIRPTANWSIYFGPIEQSQYEGENPTLNHHTWWGFDAHSGPKRMTIIGMGLAVTYDI